LTRCLNIVSGLLADDLYFARRQGGQLATVLYRKWARPQVSTNLTPAPQKYFSAAPFALGAVIKQPDLWFDCDWPSVQGIPWMVAGINIHCCQG